MKPILGYPRLVIYSGKTYGELKLKDSSDDTQEIPIRALKYLKDALFITENGHCFKVLRVEKVRIVTPWYWWWWEPICAEVKYHTVYCPELSHENVYPILWRAVDSARWLHIWYERNSSLLPFRKKAGRARVIGGYWSTWAKRHVKKLIEQRVPLRTIMEDLVANDR